MEESNKEQKQKTKIYYNYGSFKGSAFEENVTSINLKECENDLRRYYMIYNETLYMIKIDKEIIGMKIPKVEYEIYYKNVSGNY